MACALDDGGTLGPGHEAVIAGQGKAHGAFFIGAQAAVAGEGDGVLAGGHFIGRGLGAAHEVRLLLHQALHPFPAVTVDGLLVPEQHGVIVVGVGGDDLALQFGLQVVGRVERGIVLAQGLDVGHVAEGIENTPVQAPVWSLKLL